MSYLQEISQLCKSFETSYGDRIHFIGKNIHGVKVLKNNANKMLNRFHRDHQRMSTNLRTTLENFTNNLSDYVHHYLGRCKRQRMEFHRELERGHGIFMQAQKSLHQKRKNFFKEIRTEEQKCGQKKH